MTGITQEHIEKAEGNERLGPGYFASRDVAERFMADFEAEHFKPLIEKFSKEFSDHMWEEINSYLLSDTERNLQLAMWRHADDMVKYVLSGEEWAMKKFALGERYNCAKVREAVAKHVPQELQDQRIADLEAEVERLKNDIEFYRR